MRQCSLETRYLVVPLFSIHARVASPSCTRILTLPRAFDYCFALETISEGNVVDKTLALVDSACTRCTHSTAWSQNFERHCLNPAAHSVEFMNTPVRKYNSAFDAFEEWQASQGSSWHWRTTRRNHQRWDGWLPHTAAHQHRSVRGNGCGCQGQSQGCGCVESEGPALQDWIPCGRASRRVATNTHKGISCQLCTRREWPYLYVFDTCGATDGLHRIVFRSS